MRRFLQITPRPGFLFLGPHICLACKESFQEQITWSASTNLPCVYMGTGPQEKARRKGALKTGSLGKTHMATDAKSFKGRIISWISFPYQHLILLNYILRNKDSSRIGSDHKVYESQIDHRR